jgi:2-polyprenyl-6-methoxyphenol hydroxylase-like FAD-dependent oxidoreductase
MASRLVALTMTSVPHDVLIVGGGVAGLSAGLVLGRARRRMAIVDAGSPGNGPAANMQGFLSRDGMPPADLLAAGRTEVRSIAPQGKVAHESRVPWTGRRGVVGWQVIRASIRASLI